MRWWVLVLAAVVYGAGWMSGTRIVVAQASNTTGRPEAAPRRIVVGPGESLWSLGLELAPRDTDLRMWVYRVERLNHLDGAVIQPGERLVLP